MHKKKKKLRSIVAFEAYLQSQNGPVIEIVDGKEKREFAERTLAQHKYRSEYLQGEHWKQVRLEKLRSVGFSCENCRIPQFPLDVHHKTYVRKGNERLDDLAVLCRSCHEKAHG